MTTWNQFVSKYAADHNVSRKVAMKKAGPLWLKQKRTAPRSKNPKLQKPPDISEFPSMKSKKKKKEYTRRIVPQTEVIRKNHLGGAPIPEDRHELLNKRNYKRRFHKRAYVMHDSAFKYMAKKSGVEYW